MKFSLKIGLLSLFYFFIFFGKVILEDFKRKQERKTRKRKERKEKRKKERRKRKTKKKKKEKQKFFP